MAAVVGTWPFSQPAVVVCARELLNGASCVDSLEIGIKLVEDDPACGVYLVGRGAPPNNLGSCQFDGAIMQGSDLKFGAVAGLESIPSPLPVARRVMESCPHSMLVGPGAQQFAVKHGFNTEAELHIQSHSSQSQQDVGTELTAQKCHDTLGIIALDLKGNIAAGVSTSGPGGKLAGRVGDSPLPGCGLYADNEVGAACCTGEGDHILKFCPSFLTVEMMRNGLSPQEACASVVQRIKKRWLGEMFELGIIAMNIKGECGGVGTMDSWTDPSSHQIYSGFPFYTWTNGEGQLRSSTL